ncbi:putative Tubulin alpha-6 chain [Melia azedarach]|uniref:Tubulin alpha-6 chain n=1 Tax=Melia azedarach TaxID=155640 RepID=A0ACC1XYT0_MELAZ|nr:putative Tubulin alpha-6 chain [Melia azedarach]
MAVASLQILKSSLLSPVSISRSNFPGKSDSRKVFIRSRSYKRSRCYVRRKLKVCCGIQDGDNQSNGEEPPESLFMKELKRRGMTPTSLLEDTSRTDYGLDDETKLKEEDRGFSRRNAVSAELEKSLDNQRERSMALNSEGLEGLIPRAKLLLTLGGTFFLGFWPLILITVGFFSALYFYFGPTFVHDASTTPISPPQYVDPYALLEDERISQIAPGVN